MLSESPDVVKNEGTKTLFFVLENYPKEKSISTISYLQADQMVHIASHSVSNGFVCPALLLNFANDVMYVSRMK